MQKVTGSSSSREESRANTGPRVDFNFDYLDREKYSHSKKKLEVRKSEKLAAALSVFDSTCEVEVRYHVNMFNIQLEGELFPNFLFFHSPLLPWGGGGVCTHVWNKQNVDCQNGIS